MKAQLLIALAGDVPDGCTVEHTPAGDIIRLPDGRSMEPFIGWGIDNAPGVPTQSMFDHNAKPIGMAMRDYLIQRVDLFDDTGPPVNPLDPSPRRYPDPS